MNRQYSLGGSGFQTPSGTNRSASRLSLASTGISGPPLRLSDFRLSTGGAAASNNRQSVGGSAGIRRSSVRSSIAPNGGSGVSKDPRPLRDKGWQHDTIRAITEFLIETGYNQPISTKTLQTPTSKDFQSIFKFLYAKLDPRYVYQKKFEEEVPGLLKGLKYPFADQISKSQLYAVGSMHSWPNLLGMLQWIVDLIICVDKLNHTSDFDGQPGNEPTFQDEMFFKYISKSYIAFLSGDDNYEDMEHDLTIHFEQKLENVETEISRLNKEIDQLKAEHEGYVSVESPLIAAQKEHDILKSDTEKFTEYLNHLQSKKEKIKEANVTLDGEVHSKEQEFAQLEEEKATLQKQVDEQEISMTDVERMNAERNQLSKNVNTANMRLEEINKTSWEKEIETQKKLDDVERVIQEFNSFAYKLGLIPSESPYANGIEFDIKLNQHATRVEDMVSVDIKNVIRPALMELRSNLNSSLHHTEDEAIVLQENLDRLTEIVGDKIEEHRSMENRIQKLVTQYQDEKEVPYIVSYICIHLASN
ncbi:kinetochore-associated Ndc80 complex subunit ndc80, variant 2 [Basidiobolus ranarum]|uniref:Kinetochore protein NDC80 n=1 Tax=Basidiobolus ranarum TaxID=34480 RepID=A0ABR2X229_9FUNG